MVKGKHTDRGIEARRGAHDPSRRLVGRLARSRRGDGTLVALVLVPRGAGLPGVGAPYLVGVMGDAGEDQRLVVAASRAHSGRHAHLIGGLMLHQDAGDADASGLGTQIGCNMCWPAVLPA